MRHIRCPWVYGEVDARGLNATLERLLRFYGVENGSVADEQSQAYSEMLTRAQMLRQVLCRP